MVNNKLKKIIAGGGAALGTFVNWEIPDVVEIIALAGFDFIVIDNEHGPLTHASSQNLIRAAELRGITPIVRVPNSFESTILHTLDVGAHGIQVPQVNDAACASAVVSRAKYKPVGSRGVAFPRSADFGMTDLARYFDHENREVLIVTHCENTLCLENLDEICAVPEVDVIFFGPYDMSQSMGITGQVGHSRIQEAAQRVADTARRHGKAAGIFASSGEAAKEMVERGFQYITVGTDTVIFGEACRRITKAFRD
jgi:4-hydroxy-2-oxoheptanedioate aldolase